MSITVLQGRGIYGGVTEGETIVTQQMLSFMGGVDPVKGVITEKGHDLLGQKLKDRILVFQSLKGSAAAMWIISRLTTHGQKPKALVVEKADAIFIGGVVMGEITALECPQCSGKLFSGQIVRVNGNDGTITILPERGWSSGGI
ncbi:MAG: DUF126 domain-containing protein [Gracilibacteraceae bacterium]|jgi:predicted aconitase with swiveling domain|nr:DUF126 domain-containing protein [Gracilibacteraceae bacterium]